MFLKSTTENEGEIIDNVFIEETYQDSLQTSNQVSASNSFSNQASPSQESEYIEETNQDSLQTSSQISVSDTIPNQSSPMSSPNPSPSQESEYIEKNKNNDSESSEDSDFVSQEENKKTKRNYMKIDNIVRAGMRLGLSHNEMAFMGSAAAVDFDIVTPEDSQFVIDRNKVGLNFFISTVLNKIYLVI